MFMQPRARNTRFASALPPNLTKYFVLGNYALQ
jgi:hypothetical protein